MNDIERLLSLANNKQLTELGFLYSFSQKEIPFLSKESKLTILVHLGFTEGNQQLSVQYNQYESSYELKQANEEFYGCLNSEGLLVIVEWIKVKTIDQREKGLYPK